MLEPPTKFLIQHRKIVGYLLDVTHPDGGAKAVFFLARGFSRDESNEFARRLLDHPLLISSALTAVKPDIFAPKFIYEGGLVCPDGTKPHIRRVWELKPGDTHGRLVTAYPCQAARSPSTDPPP